LPVTAWQAGRQVFLVIEAIVGEAVVARAEAAGQELAVTVRQSVNAH
jgi:hypothetical protein